MFSKIIPGKARSPIEIADAIFLLAGCPFCHPDNSVKALKEYRKQTGIDGILATTKGQSPKFHDCSRSGVNRTFVDCGC